MQNDTDPKDLLTCQEVLRQLLEPFEPRPPQLRVITGSAQRCTSPRGRLRLAK